MLVSVIIPVYNAASYLRRCIDSVADQTYTDLEIILIDDGSNDGSDKICDDYITRDSRFEVIHQQNQGASIARKEGIAKAKGEWLSFVDSDDIVEKDYIECLFDAAKQHQTQIAACDQIQHKEGDVIQMDKSSHAILFEDRELHRRFFHYQFWGFWGKIYHRSVFENVYFPQYTINEDYVVMAQLFDKYKQMAYVPIGLYHYMVHPSSLSHQPLSSRMFDEYYNKLWVVDFYKKNNLYYIKNAEAQLVETCIKLIGKINTSKFQAEKTQMKEYLRANILKILLNPNLLPALKMMSLRLCI